MICHICGGNISVLTGQQYHYVECGLDNIYLDNITTEVCDQCGATSPRIPRFNSLHKALAADLVAQAYSLSGKESRFLRKERGLKAKDWATMLGVDPSTLSRWEREEQPIGDASDRAIRLLYIALFQIQEKTHFSYPILNALRTSFTVRTQALHQLDVQKLSQIYFS